MTPLLLIVIGTQPVVAVGTDIAYGALTKTVGGWQHLRNKTVDLGVSSWLAVGSVPGAIGGVILVESLPSPPDEALLWGVAGALGFTVDHHARPRALHPRRRRQASASRCRSRAQGEGHGGRPGPRARLHPRRHVGRQRRADRPRADPRLPPHAAPRRRHRRLPRRGAAVGRRHRARDRRQRRLRADGEHPHRLDPRRAARRAARARRARRRAPARARRRDARRRARRRLEGGARPAGLRDHRPAAARRSRLAYWLTRSRKRRAELAAQPV